MEPLISIIIPFYNDRNYLEACINSILRQNFEAWQAVFVDDFSTDSGSQIIEKIASTDSRVILIHNRVNLGVAQSRKNGLAYATSPYIMFLDGDDMLTMNALSALWQGINNADICIGQHYILKGQNKITTKSRTVPGFYSGQSLHEIKERMIYSANGYSGMSVDGVIWQTLFKRNFIYSNLYYIDNNLWFSEDHLLLAAAMADAKTLRIIDDYVYYYRKHNDNVTVRYKPHYFENAVLLHRDFEYLLNDKKEPKIMQKTNDWFFLKNVEHSIKREVMQSGKNYVSCKAELEKMQCHPLVKQLLNDENLAILDKSCRKYLKLLRRGWFRCIYISLKWKSIKERL